MSQSISYKQSRQRKWLLARRDDLLAQIDMTRASRLGGESSRNAETTDFKDLVDQQQQTTLRDSELGRDLDELVAVEDALQRLADGRYGLCADCGEAIDVRRLLAYPAAVRCVTCQIAFENLRVPK